MRRNLQLVLSFTTQTTPDEFLFKRLLKMRFFQLLNNFSREDGLRPSNWRLIPPS